jgi:hypothetical protein
MTEIKEEIPCCENCSYFVSPQIGYWGCENNNRGEVRILSNEELLAHKTMGCLSHPGARAYLNKDIIKKLETLRDEINVENNNAEQIPDTQGNVNEAMIYVIEEEVIPLLKGGKKNE